MNRNGRYYFNRRIPSEFHEFDPRPLVRIALNTDSRKEAVRLATIQNDQLENYWKELIQTGSKHELTTYEKLVHLARLSGFTYLNNNQIAQSTLDQIFARLKFGDSKNNALQVSAVLGGTQEPTLKLNDAIPRYISYAKGKILNKSANQVRKWENPRRLAMRKFIECVGNKDLINLNRDDLLKYRDWWISRIEHDGRMAATANKNIVLIKTIIETVNENLNLKMDTKHLFHKIVLPDENQKRRLPFDSDYLVSTLLNPDNLSGLNHQARWTLHASAETGAGVSELVGLLPEDIVLDHVIPHIAITPRQKKALKTKYRKRIIPLVGFALDAFKACPTGFTDYQENPDALSAVLSKYLKENELFPSYNLLLAS